MFVQQGEKILEAGQERRRRRMISYEKQKWGKQLMKQFIAEGELEKAAFIGLMYQMPIRTGDA